MRVKLFPNVTRHHLITHTNYLLTYLIIYSLLHKNNKINKIYNYLLQLQCTPVFYGQTA